MPALDGGAPSRSRDGDPDAGIRVFEPELQRRGWPEQDRP